MTDPIGVGDGGSWKCPSCGSTELPAYAVLEMRTAIVVEVADATLWLGDTIDYEEPDTNAPTHWIICSGCGARIPATGWGVEVS